jgi:predicted enzyme related to lactoylglutathione lyase
MSERIDYIELPGGDLAATKSFYASAFGWGFTDYGPSKAGALTIPERRGTAGHGEVAGVCGRSWSTRVFASHGWYRSVFQPRSITRSR